MNILVTGGAGFVGSHLARELIDAGHDVMASDKGDADLSFPGAASGLLLAGWPDYVVHLAARYGRILCRDEPHRAVVDNTAATTELGAGCAERGIPVLYASSSEVYGDHGEDRITEDSELRMPTTIYGLSKRWGEEVLNLYLPLERLCTVRMNMLYGPRQRAGYGCCALATFIDNAKRGESFTVHRGTSRSWLYISDAVKALRQLVEGHHYGVFNLGNDRETLPMEETAQIVREEVGGGFEVVDPPPDQIRHKNFDSSKVSQVLGWRPSVTLRQGIRQTLGGRVAA